MHLDKLLVFCSLPCFLPFSLAQDVQQPLVSTDAYTHEDDTRTPHRIAIIGAGAAGSSAAYHISLFTNQSALSRPISITAFDSGTRPGGRSTTVNAFDNPSHPVELGASIFVKINHILYNASQEFGLVTNDASSSRPRGSKFGLGVWDGSEFVFKQVNSEDEDGGTTPGWRNWKGWWDITKLLWRYGMGPIRTQRATSDAVGRFLKFYEEPVFPFASLDSATEEVGLSEVTGSTGKDVLESVGAGGGFAHDIVQASTRVNYAQNLDQIHGLEALVCMSTQGAMSVEGGNWQMFDGMIEYSAATFYANTTITQVERHSNGVYAVKSTMDEKSTGKDYGASTQEFDTIILAAPYQYAGINFSPALSHTPTAIDYVTLHVTLFTSPHRLSPAFFGMQFEDEVPDMILTTLPKETKMFQDASRDNTGVGRPGFWSISMLRTIVVKSEDDPQYLYKIFSPAPLTASWMSRLLHLNHPPNYNSHSYSTTEGGNDSLSTLPKRDITWLHEKVWNSYPYEIPRTTFERIRLDGENDGGGKGVWYTSGMESFISTMETSALMGKNVARLIVDELEMRR